VSASTPHIPHCLPQYLPYTTHTSLSTSCMSGPIAHIRHDMHDSFICHMTTHIHDSLPTYITARTHAFRALIRAFAGPRDCKQRDGGGSNTHHLFVSLCVCACVCVYTCLYVYINICKFMTASFSGPGDGRRDR